MHWMKKIRHGSKKHEGALQNIVEDREVMALVYLCDDLTIRAEASEDSTKVSPCPVDRWWEIRDVTMDEDYQVWEKVSAEVKGKVYEGYIPGLSAAR